jgi:hypothetical protein
MSAIEASLYAVLQESIRAVAPDDNEMRYHFQNVSNILLSLYKRI